MTDSDRLDHAQHTLRKAALTILARATVRTPTDGDHWQEGARDARREYRQAFTKSDPWHERELNIRRWVQEAAGLNTDNGDYLDGYRHIVQEIQEVMADHAVRINALLTQDLEDLAMDDLNATLQIADKYAAIAAIING